jgi:hypothetical protein
MDIEEFVQKHQPGMRTSRLDKYAKEIKALKEKKYTDEQIREWLATNGLQISREAIRRYVKKLTAGSQSTTPVPVITESEPKSVEAAATAPSNESQAEKLRRKLAEQQGDADKTRFKHDKSGNIK